MSDYYIENGLYVFTEQYHIKRGYCCKSGCRHCPYGFSDEKKEEISSKKTNLKSRASEKKNPK